MLATTTIIAGIGLGIAAAGAGVQYTGQVKAEKAADKSEQLREQQMNLDAQRKRRQAIREMIINRSIAVSNGVNQGASTNDSSIIGSQSQQTNSAAQNLVATTQSQGIGHGLFKANAEYAAGQGVANLGGNISGFGGQVVQNSEMISRVGAKSGLWKSDL